MLSLLAKLRYFAALALLSVGEWSSAVACLRPTNPSGKETTRADTASIVTLIVFLSSGGVAKDKPCGRYKCQYAWAYSKHKTRECITEKDVKMITDAIASTNGKDGEIPWHWTRIDEDPSFDCPGQVGLFAINFERGANKPWFHPDGPDNWYADVTVSRGKRVRLAKCMREETVVCDTTDTGK